MTPADQRALSVCLAGVAALLRAGVGAAEALREGAVHAGRLRSRLLEAADRAAAGMDPAAALGEALPQLRALIGESDAALPDRLDRLATVCGQRYGLARRLRAASLYPLTLVVGLVVVAGAVWWAQRQAEQVMAVELAAYRALYAPWLLIGLAALMVGLTAWAMRGARVPIWVRAFPGSRVFPLSEAADFLAIYGVYRDPALADLSPTEAARRAGLSGVEPPMLATIRALADAAPDPGEALRDAVERLDQQAALAARRLAMSMSAALLIVVAIGVLGLGLSGAYLPVLDLATLQ